MAARTMPRHVGGNRTVAAADGRPWLATAAVGSAPKSRRANDAVDCGAAVARGSAAAA
jgi:hypothetical protein